MTVSGGWGGVKGGVGLVTSVSLFVCLYHNSIVHDRLCDVTYYL
jgi:hypothetical protein